MQRRLVFTGVLAVLVLGVVVYRAWPLAGGSAPAEAVDPALVARGIEVYRANYCGTCHTLTAANTRGTFGPPHNNEGLDAARHLASPGYTGAATTAAEYIRESLLEPGLFYTPGYESTNHHMPAFGHLPAADLDALVMMLASQHAE